jgi:putative zinc finger/helix-turn-helix YgiT family protein
MKEKVDCSYCDGTAELRTEKKEIEFRKERFTIHQLFYRCPKCGEEFTTNEVDFLTTEQIYNQYREKHKIPFPEEITSIRDKYRLSAAKMSQVLGLGINSYANFEKGEIPSSSIGNLIRTASQPKVFRDLLLNARECFSGTTFERSLSHIEALIKDEDYPDIKCQKWIFEAKHHKIPSSYNGYKMLDVEKISNLVIYFLSHCTSDFNDRLKLNKLFFYTDFFNYQRCVRSITGITYKKIPYGPFPSNDCIFEFLKSEKLIDSRIVNSGNGTAVELFEPKDSYNWEIFSETERETIIYITNKYGKLSSWDILELGRSEMKEFDEREGLINYQDHAFDINKP